jgi:hypothetical protein
MADEPFVRDPDTGRNIPQDDRAVYGFPVLGGREEPSDYPHYESIGALVDAIREVEPGDRVRVNDKPFYPAVETEQPVMGEGFIYEPDRGARREVTVTNPSNNPPGTFDSPWIRRVPDYSSDGELHILEVDWDRD